MASEIPTKYDSNGRMTYAYMVWHLSNNQGAILLNGRPVTRIADLPRPEQIASAEEKVALAEEKDAQIKKLQEERDALLKEREDALAQPPSQPVQPPSPSKRGRKRGGGDDHPNLPPADLSPVHPVDSDDDDLKELEHALDQ